MKKYFLILFLLLLGCGGDQGDLPDLFSNSSKDLSSSSLGLSSSSDLNSSSSNKISSSSSSKVSSGSSASSSSLSSSSFISISSSSASSSSTPSVTYCEEIYETIVIGYQTWFNRNLNCEDEKNGIHGENNDPYGKLYDWKTAKKACPSGWHLPTVEDWYELMSYLDHSSKPAPYEDGDIVSETIGEYLGDWDDSYTDNCGDWWSATGAGNFALNWSLCKESNAIYWYENSISNAYSVRCLKNKN